MKTLIIYSPKIHDVGGVNTQIRYLIDGLSQFYEIYLLTYDRNVLLISSISGRPMMITVKELMEQIQPDLLLTTDIFLQGWKVVKHMNENDVPVVCRVGSVISNYFASRLFDILPHFPKSIISVISKSLNVFLSKRLEKIDLVVFNSKAISNQFCRDVDTTVIYNGTILPEILHTEKFEFNYKIGFTGRIEIRKGIEYIINAIRTLNKSNLRVKLEVIGPITDGSYYDYLQSLIKTFNLEDQIEFLGRMPQEEWTKHAKMNWDLFVFSSNNERVLISEGLPNVIIESMAIGVPVLGFPVSSVPEIISHGKNGFISDNVTSISLAKNLLDIYQFSSEKFASIKWNAQQTIYEKFDVKKMIHQYKKQIEKLFQK